MEKVKKPIYKKWWFWVIIVVVVFAIAAGGGSSKKDSDKNSVTDTEQAESGKSKDTNKDAGKEDAPEEDLSQIETDYTLGAGHYTAGVDLPVGKCNLTAVSGNGNVSSSNMFNGGINAMFGVDDGNGLYESSFNGLKMKENVELKISGDVVVQVSYTEVTGGMSGREYDESAAVELGSGNYTAGTDFPAGTYTVTAVDGTGNVSTSNLYDGGMNEMFGVDDGNGLYTPEVKNVELSDGVELKVSGVNIRLVPVKEQFGFQKTEQKSIIKNRTEEHNGKCL